MEQNNTLTVAIVRRNVLEVDKFTNVDFDSKMEELKSDTSISRITYQFIEGNFVTDGQYWTVRNGTK